MQTHHDILHGKNLQQILEYLIEKYGFETLGNYIQINCFLHDPSLKSSLKFLRKTPWVREKVENFYVESVLEEQKSKD